MAHLHAAPERDPRTAPGLGLSVHAGRRPRLDPAGTEPSAASPQAMRLSCRLSLEEDGEMTERISLKGKVAIRDLGRPRVVGAYVELLAERGARVVVNDLGTEVSGFGKDSAVAEHVADLTRSRGGEAIANGSDVSTLKVAVS